MMTTPEVRRVAGARGRRGISRPEVTLGREEPEVIKPKGGTYDPDSCSIRAGLIPKRGKSLDQGL